MYKLATDIQIAPVGGFKGFGPLGLEGKDAGQAPGIFTNFITSAIGIITVIAIIWFVFLVITGAVSIMTAGSDKGQIESARKRLMSGVIGLVVLIAAIFLIQLIGKIIGIENILDIGKMIEAINIK